MKKKILIISRSFYPMNTPRSFRTTELAKQFSREGFDVTVITHFDPNYHLSFQVEHNLKILDFGSPKKNSIIAKSGKIQKVLSRIFARIVGLLFDYPNIYYIFLVKKAIQRIRGYDILISIAAPHSIHWGVAFYWNREIAKRWIADCGDPFMGRQSDRYKPLFYFSFLEKYFCRKVDFITVPTNNSVNAYYPEFRNKIRVIPQGFNFEKFPPVVRNSDNSSVPIFVYAGSFIPGLRDPTEFLEYLSLIPNDYVFYIYSTTPFNYKSFQEKSNGRIIFKDPVNRDVLLSELAKADFVVNFENVGTHETPSKLIEYAILKKPILSIKTGKLDKINVQKFLQRDYSQSLIIDDINQYKIEEVTKKFSDLF